MTKTGPELLKKMKPEEWEALCDGCARCCLIRLVDDQTGKIAVTGVACRHLDISACRCLVYDNRSIRVPTCLELTPKLAVSLSWLPSSCAYRLIAAGMDLPDWHPLVSGDKESVHEAGISIRDKAVSEDEIAEEDLGNWVLSDMDDY